jgi:hypothetical protein
VIELVAITDDPRPPAPPLRVLACGELAVLYTGVEDGEVSAEVLWRREALLESLMEERDLLPVRFGTRVPDPEAAARALTPRRDELAARLARVRGAVELAVRVHALERDAPPPAAASGREYMAAKAERSRAAMAVHEPLATLARASLIQHGWELLRAAYLVDRDRVGDFTGQVTALQRDHPQLALLCTGPWPPYSFAEEGT